MLKLAVILQILLVLYHQITTLFDLYPFNGVRFYSRRERRMEAGINLILMGLPLLAFVFRLPMLMELGVYYYFVLLACEVATWWLPYFFGASPKWVEIYSRIQARTITILPRRGTNPAPNLEHLILMVITLATSMATLSAYHSIPAASFRHWWIGLLSGIVMIGGVLYQTSWTGRKKPKTSSV